MIALIRLLGLRGILLVVAFATVVALMVRVDVVTSSRDAAQARLATADSALAAARATADRMARERAAAMAAVASERSRADAYARSARALRDAIERDAGGDRDAPTAPVLRDAIEGLQRTFATTLARRSRPWSLTVIVAGRIERIVSAPDHAACVAAVVEAVAEIKARPTFATEAKGRVLLICRVDDGRIA